MSLSQDTAYLPARLPAHPTRLPACLPRPRPAPGSCQTCYLHRLLATPQTLNLNLEPRGVVRRATCTGCWLLGKGGAFQGFQVFVVYTRVCA